MRQVLICQATGCDKPVEVYLERKIGEGFEHQAFCASHYEKIPVSEVSWAITTPKIVMEQTKEKW